jgi:predicted MFS family arabinose efflux permease
VRNNGERTFGELYSIIALTFAYFIGFNMLIPILPLYIVEIGASKFELGIIMAILPAFTILTRLPFGFISDRLGKWLTLLSSLFMQMFAYLLFSFAPSTIYLYPAAILHALSFASFGPISITIALDSAQASSRGSVMGKYYFSIGSAMILGPLLTSFLALNFEYRQILFVASLFSLISILSFLTMQLKSAMLIQSRRLTRELQIKQSELIPLKSILRILRLRNVLVICIAQICYFTATGSFYTLFAIHAKENLLLATSAISILFVISGIPNTLIRIPIGNLSDKIGRKKPLLFGYTLAFFALFSIPHITTIFFIALLMGVYGVAWGTRTAPTAALMSDSVKSKDINLASTLIWLTSDIGIALGSFWAGYATLIFKIPTILKITSLSVIPGIIIILFLKERSSIRV